MNFVDVLMLKCDFVVVMILCCDVVIVIIWCFFLLYFLYTLFYGEKLKVQGSTYDNPVDFLSWIIVGYSLYMMFEYHWVGMSELDNI